MKRRAWIGPALALAWVTALAAGTAGADDGPYVSESFGVARAGGRLAATVGTALQERVSIGMRLGNFAIEPWIGSALQTRRDGAFLHLVAGRPAAGTADLESFGLDIKYIVPIRANADLFVRAGPLVAEGNGALDGYRGRGIGFSGGAQVKGQVRALGFLWAPLFFLKRGPMATGALVLDAGYELSSLRKPGGEPIDAGVVHISLGFGFGSTF